MQERWGYLPEVTGQAKLSQDSCPLSHSLQGHFCLLSTLFSELPKATFLPRHPNFGIWNGALGPQSAQREEGQFICSLSPEMNRGLLIQLNKHIPCVPLW